MSPPFWMHCNICTMQLSQNVKMFLLNCSHLLCKTCMKLTDHGKTCPICKKSIKFEDVTKLPEKMKSFFTSDISTLLSHPLKVMDFQSEQQNRLFKSARDLKVKTQKAAQMKAKLDQEVRQLKAAYEKMHAHRILMQERLKEVYMKNQRLQKHRSPLPSSPLSYSSAGHSSSHHSMQSSFKSRPPLKTTERESSRSSGSNFFNNDAPMMRNNNSKISGFTSTTGSSQSNRKPFFA